ncbi:alpha/beta fold hydrolase [Neotamlana laminarinivorans]|uniref:Alpha/beta hydrolase n=1 Tax=Neotamlana laminarinivorans TaxID=2883124 RepID=A0A9X1L568_9FLAO|nr:alpha/beta hydrolase [Tamlana laminarinivorans]MCB4799061.1 alpha/beta hydrolase [Tamlana laminarinivorans]
MTFIYKEASVFYTDSGEGETLVLLHGFLEYSGMWEAFIPELSKTNRVICVDLLGHGKTDCLGYVHSMELMSETVCAVLRHLNIAKVNLVGHSMGGYVALAFADNWPEMVSGLCLLNSTAEADSIERKQNRTRAIEAVKNNHKLFIRMAIANLFWPENRNRFANQIKETIKEATKTPLQGIIAALEGMKIRQDRQHVLKNASFKTLIIAGEKDPVLFYKSIVRQAEANNTPVVSFPDGHMSHIENSTEFLNEIAHFIEKK